MAERITFCRPDGAPCTILDKRTGKRRRANSGAPAVLAAFGGDCAARLRASGIPGAFVERWRFDPPCAPDGQS